MTLEQGDPVFVVKMFDSNNSMKPDCSAPFIDESDAQEWAEQYENNGNGRRTFVSKKHLR